MQETWIKSFRYALTGMKVAWKEERNFKIELFCALAAVALSILLNISQLEFVIIILVSGLVLATELLNTALEELCDKFQPTHDSHIAKIKDLAAAAVLLVSLTALTIGIIIFGSHLF